MLAREGIWPTHGDIRGPVAPVNDPKYPLGGYQNGSMRVIHDAGDAFVVWVHGPDDWLTGYIDVLPESLSTETWDEFIQQAALVAGDGSLRGKLAGAVLDSLGINATTVSQKKDDAATEDFVKEGCITAPEVPESRLVASLVTKIDGGMVERVPDAKEVAEKELTP